MCCLWQRRANWVWWKWRARSRLEYLIFMKHGRPAGRPCFLHHKLLALFFFDTKRHKAGLARTSHQQKHGFASRLTCILGSRVEIIR